MRLRDLAGLSLLVVAGALDAADGLTVSGERERIRKKWETPQ